MKLPKLVNGKLVAVIAFIFGVVGFFLWTKDFYFNDIIYAILWLVGGFFTWRRRSWAAVLLALMAWYDLIFDLILTIITFKENVPDLLADFNNLPESVIWATGTIVYSIGAIMLLCVIYYGVYIVFKDKYN